MSTYGDIGTRAAAWAATEALSHAEPICVLGKFAQVKPLPKNKTDTVKFRRPIPFAPATTPLTEGVAPTAQAMNYEDVTVTLDQYGAVTELTDKVHDMAEDSVLKDMMMLSGEQAQETMELVTYGVIKGGTTVFYANGSTRAEVNTPITRAKQRAVVKALKGNRAKKVTKMLGASVKISTEPVNKAYIAFAHTDCESDIRDLEGFTPVEKYGQVDPLPEEIGKCEDVRYLCSPLLDPFVDAGGTAGSMMSTTGAAADVYPILFIGQEAFGTVPLKGAGAIKPMVLNPGEPSKSDPLGQMGYVSWKAWFKAAILNQGWLVRFECAATNDAA